MAPRTKRSIVHRPVDKISQLLTNDAKKAIDPYDSAYHSSFQPADHETYLKGHTHPVIDGYYTQVKNIIEQESEQEPVKAKNTLSRLVGRMDLKSAAGDQRNLGSVRNLSETKRFTHGIVTATDMDMRKIMYPGCEERDDRESKDEEVEQLKLRIHGAKSNSDPTGGRTWKALQYEACTPQKEELDGRQIRTHRRTAGVGDCQRIGMKNRSDSGKSRLIVNQDLDEKFLSLQDAIHYLNRIRSALIKKDKSAIDICRKTLMAGLQAEEAIQMLSSTSTVRIDYSNIRPVIEILKLENVDQDNIQKLWDLFDHHLPLSGFEFGRLVKPFQEHCLHDDLYKPEREQKVDQDHLELRFKGAKFRDYETAGDLISPKPGTPFGLGHMDYFLPRRSEDIKTIFRNFDLDERTFADAWKEARNLETCKMNKVSAENFKTILKQKDVKLLH